MENNDLTDERRSVVSDSLKYEEKLRQLHDLTSKPLLSVEDFYKIIDLIPFLSKYNNFNKNIFDSSVLNTLVDFTLNNTVEDHQRFIEILTCIDILLIIDERNIYVLLDNHFYNFISDTIVNNIMKSSMDINYLCKFVILVANIILNSIIIKESVAELIGSLDIIPFYLEFISTTVSDKKDLYSERNGYLDNAIRKGLYLMSIFTMNCNQNTCINSFMDTSFLILRNGHVEYFKEAIDILSTIFDKHCYIVNHMSFYDELVNALNVEILEDDENDEDVSTFNQNYRYLISFIDTLLDNGDIHNGKMLSCKLDDNALLCYFFKLLKYNEENAGKLEISVLDLLMSKISFDGEVSNDYSFDQIYLIVEKLCECTLRINIKSKILQFFFCLLLNSNKNMLSFFFKNSIIVDTMNVTKNLQLNEPNYLLLFIEKVVMVYGSKYIENEFYDAFFWVCIPEYLDNLSDNVNKEYRGKIERLLHHYEYR